MTLAQQDFIGTVQTHFHNILGASADDVHKIQEWCRGSTQETCQAIASLSNWYISKAFDFALDEGDETLKFKCTEQVMMAYKVRFFQKQGVLAPLMKGAG